LISIVQGLNVNYQEWDDRAFVPDDLNLQNHLREVLWFSKLREIDQPRYGLSKTEYDQYRESV
jgi:hypothetical protein